MSIENDEPLHLQTIWQLIVELASATEYYQPDETKWFPSAIRTLEEGLRQLNASNIPTPMGVRFVLRRAGSAIAEMDPIGTPPIWWSAAPLIE